MSDYSSPLTLPRLTKADLLRRDVFGRTALHIAVLTNKPAAFRELLAHPDSHHALLLTDYENGWNVLHLIFYHKRLRCWTALRNHLDGAAHASLLLAHLLKQKDRSRLPPLALLQNDSKELMWIPGYINEKGDVHLIRRFAKVPRWIPHDWWSPQRGSLDVFMYGTNSNHHLGLADARDRSVPSRVLPIDLHAKDCTSDVRDLLRHPRVSGVALAKYHSVVVMRDGRLLTCGVGAKGRLGHGNTSNLYQYQSVALFEQCGAAFVAVASSHTLALTRDNQLYAWGVNSLNQLGFTSEHFHSFKTSPGDIYENIPKPVCTGDLRRVNARFRGVAVSSIHSMAYTSHLLFFWGLDIGQMGPVSHPSGPRSEEFRANGSTFKGTVVASPHEVAVRDEIKMVATCETCTCVVTTTNDIFVHYGGQRVKLPKIPARGFSEATFDCFKPSRLTRAPDIKKVVACSHSSVLILLTCGDILSFGISPGSDILKSSKSIKYNYIWKAYDCDMRAVDMDGATDGSLVLCTKNGFVFMKSEHSGSRRRNSMSTSAAPVAGSKFRKVENVNRVVRVSCDDAFASFAFQKDDVDSLPYKLQKNDFFKDMEYLSILSEADGFRKQDKLLDTDHESNCYVTDYIFPSKDPEPADEDDLLVSRVEKLSIDDNLTKLEEVEDLLLKAHHEKFNFSVNPETKTVDMYQALEDSVALRDLLKNEAALRNHLIQESKNSHLKFYDGRIKFTNDPSILIAFHTKLLEHRSSFCSDLFHPKNEGEYFVHEKIEGYYQATSKELVFKSDVDLRAVVVLLHFVYTNKVLGFWEDYPGGSKCPEPIRKSKNDFRLLKDLFRMDSFYGKDSDYLELMSQMMDDCEEGDVLIELGDLKKLAQGSMLVARSAFFETILSSRWDNLDDASDSEPKIVSFENVNSLHFRIILKHMHGCNDLHVFDDLIEVIEESFDPDDFVNVLLELIEIADEMLLLQLKHLCELAIQEFINSDNVLVLLAHSDYLGAGHLLMLCCWYVYNNLEIISFDSNLQSLPEYLVAKLEKQMLFFQNCKRLDFVVGNHGEINKSMLQNVYPDTLVDQFLYAPGEFNKLFMNGETFEPLFDIKPEADENKRKLSSRRMSRKSSMDAVAELRKVSIGARRASENAIESAVEDFEVVGRRRKLKQKENVEKDDFKPSTSTELNNPRDSVVSTNEKVSSNQMLEPRVLATSSLQHQSHASTSTPWGARRTSLSSQSTMSAPLLGSADFGRKGTKIKFAPSMKLSQKQRRKMNEAQATSQPQEESSVKLRNPWAVNDKSSVPVKDKLSCLPVLGATKAPEPSSLAAVMLQESTRLEEQRYQESQRRTLQEIQQEQEFARWWEEESKRVQHELGPARAKPKRGRGRKKSGAGGVH